MTENDLTYFIEKLSVDFVLAEPEDSDALLSLKTYLQNILNISGEIANDTLSQKASESIKIIDDLIDGKGDNPNTFMETLGENISSIQEIERISPDTHRAPQKALDQPSETPEKMLDEVSETRQQPVGLIHPGELPSHIDEGIFSDFLMLQPPILEKIEALVLELEHHITEEKVDAAKRLIHTMKGEAGFLNLFDTEKLCHKTEDLIENGYFSSYTDTFLEVVDWLKTAFEYYSGKGSEVQAAKDILDKLDMLSHKEKLTGDKVTDIRDIETETQELFTEMQVVSETVRQNTAKFLENFEREKNTINSFILNLSSTPQDSETLKWFTDLIASFKAVSVFLEFKEFSFLFNEMLALLFFLQEHPKGSSRAVISTLIESFELIDTLFQNRKNAMETGKQTAPLPGMAETIFKIRCIVNGQVMDPSVTTSIHSDPKKVGALLVASGVTDEDTVNKCLTLQTEHKKSDKIGEILVKEGHISTKNVAMALQNQTNQSPKTTILKESINIDTDKLDKIVNMIGELAIAQSMIIQSQEIKTISSPEFHRNMGMMDKIIRQLQESGLSLRMIPIRSVFQKMERVIRDVSKKSGKQVNFKMFGEDTELDKTIVDKLRDPLMHIVRNAVDHGIENNTAHRTKLNKPETGTITLKAYHKGGNIIIQIQDDGNGLDKDKILKKGISLGMVDKEAELSENEIFKLILEPGFSTAEIVTDISGRGVGMNVVKDNITSLRGRINIHSVKGEGTVFTLKIPLTLAIIDGMIVKVDTERYIIPTLSIITSTKLNKNDITSVFDKGEMVNVQGDLLPLFNLGHFFSRTPKKTNGKDSLIVVIEENGLRTAILVDALLGKQQIVIKSLGENMQNISGISGGAIMPDGQVGLIIDVNSLIHISHNKN